MKIVTALLGCIACLIGAVTAKWTEWSSWSSCSRTCDGGISSQTRSCFHGGGGGDGGGSPGQPEERCGGQDIRYRICGIQNCSRLESELATDVCSALDDTQVRGKTFKWSSSSSSSSSSSRGQSGCYISCSPINDLSIQPVYIAQPDGTWCNLHGLSNSDSALPNSTGSQGICVAGVCRKVDCGDVSGFKKVLDRCGVCGGDNTSCLSTQARKQSPSDVYRWRESGYSACSASCGLGEQSLLVICEDTVNDVTVHDEFCRLSLSADDKPHRVRVCSGSACDNDRAVWVTGEWQKCSKSCDVGVSSRSVYCVLQQNDIYERTSEAHCHHLPRPIAEQNCNHFECPRWIAGQWSHCSVTCGSGTQQRAIVCKRTDALDCDPSEKLPTLRSCRTHIHCPSHHSDNWEWESEAALHGVQDFEGSFDINGRLIRDFERGNEVAEHVAADHHRITAIPEDAIETSKEPEAKDSMEPVQAATMVSYITESAMSATTTMADSTTEQHPQTSGMSDSLEPLETVQAPETPTSTHVPQMMTQLPPQGEPEHSESSPGERPSLSGEDEAVEPDFQEWNSSLTYDEFEAEYGKETNREEDEDSVVNYDEYDRKAGIDGDGTEDDERKGLIEGAYRGGPPVENRKTITIPSFVVSPWSRCSATCGTAIRRRRVSCKVLLEPSKIIQELPDFRCEGPKPQMQDYCALPECQSKTDTKTHSWMLTGYGPCSKSCGGGSQEGEFHCLRVPQYYKVDKIRCLRQPIPSRIKRPCNIQPCPPRWNPLPFGQCSVSCGDGGQRVRQLQCVQETYDQKMRIVPDAQCKDADAPTTTAPCDLVPCPAKWVIGNWTQCSVTCGQGIQTRAVKCEQKLSSHQLVVVDDVSCWQQTDKPDTERVCEAGRCHTTGGQKSAAIRRENSNFVQLKPLSSVSLIVGTNASLIAGSLIVIQCPLAKKFNRLKISWKENDRAIDLKKSRRFRVDRHGSLRIRNSRPSDRGVYSCVAGHETVNSTIRFHTIEESLREMRTRINFLNGEKKRAFYSEDFMNAFQSELRKLFAKMRKASFSGQFLISKMPTNSVPLQYVPFTWSQCSVECGGGGIQSREVLCTILADDFFLEVDEGFCGDRRLQKPIADRDCGFGRCPHWEPLTWSQCGDDNCADAGVGERRRELRCVSPTGERLEADRCRGQLKPVERESCPNENCIAVWKPSNWTQCSVTCGGRGIKTRSFQCVWRQSKKPVAGSMCLSHEKPTSSKPCYTTTPCANIGCRDESKYCHMIPALQMCRFPQYRQECCLSCSLVRASTPQQITSPSPYSHK